MDNLSQKISWARQNCRTRGGIDCWIIRRPKTVTRNVSRQNRRMYNTITGSNTRFKSHDGLDLTYGTSKIDRRSVVLCGGTEEIVKAGTFVKLNCSCSQTSSSSARLIFLCIKGTCWPQICVAVLLNICNKSRKRTVSHWSRGMRLWYTSYAKHLQSTSKLIRQLHNKFSSIAQISLLYWCTCLYDSNLLFVPSSAFVCTFSESALSMLQTVYFHLSCQLSIDVDCNNPAALTVKSWYRSTPHRQT